MFTNPVFISTFQNTFSAQFDVDERIDLSDISGLESDTTMSIGLWVKSNDLDGTFKTLFGGGLSTDENPRLQILISNNNKYSFFIRDDAGLNSTIVEGNIEDNTWRFLVLTRNGSTWRLYDNAVNVATKAFNPGTFNLDRFNLAALDSNLVLAGLLSGKLDEASIWNIELVSADITRLYNSGKPTDLLKDSLSANLIHWWRFTQEDKDNSPIIKDHAGSNDGTAINMDTSNIQSDVPDAA